MLLNEESPTSVPNAPCRRLTQNDKAVLNATTCSDEQELQIDDKVSLADAKAVFLTGLVSFIGPVHFATGTWVGIQLVGPSVGKGNCDGSYKGKSYFAHVGKKNGVMAPIHLVNHYSPAAMRDDDEEEVQTKAMVTVDALTSTRVAAILQADVKDQRRPRYKEEIYIRRLKESTLGQAIVERDFRSKSKLKYAKPDATLCDCDFQLVLGLDKTHQNFCLSDPTLPDNPITFASQAFLDLTGYRLGEIMGRNCRFLQGKDTDKAHVDRIRQSIVEGADCHVCLLNYRKDGTAFYNRLFMTALRDNKGRIKNYLGVQCQVDEETARKINDQEMSLFQAGMARAGTHFTKRRSPPPTPLTESVKDDATITSSIATTVTSSHMMESTSSTEVDQNAPSMGEPKKEDASENENKDPSETAYGTKHAEEEDPSETTFCSNVSLGRTHKVNNNRTETEDQSETMFGTERSFFDLDEAMFRMTRDDPFAPMTEEEEVLYTKMKSNPFTGYSGTEHDRKSKD